MVDFNGSCSYIYIYIYIYFSIDINLLKNCATNSLNHPACILKSLQIADNIKNLLESHNILDDYPSTVDLESFKNPIDS